MANTANKYPQNVPGMFYVDNQCIDCDACREAAPKFFAREENDGHSFVFHQPQGQDEIDKCEEALEGCPVEAIGDDGDET